MCSAKEIEDYVNGKTNEKLFISSVVKDVSLDDKNVLSTVESVCASLNINLRHEIESNSNRLVDQAGSIDTLDSMQRMIHFDVKDAARNASTIGQQLKDHYEKFDQQLVCIRKLMKLQQILRDHLHIKALLEEWKTVDFVRQSDIIVEIRKICAISDGLSNLRMYNDQVRLNIDIMYRKTREQVISELYNGLNNRESSKINNAVLSLCTIDPDRAEQEFAKIIKKGVDEIDDILKILTEITSEEQMTDSLEKLALTTKLEHWLNQLQLIDKDLAKKFADRLGKTISIRLSNYSPSVIYILNVLHTCANHQRSGIATPIKDALCAIDAVYADERYAAMTNTIDSIFKQGSVHRGTALTGIHDLFHSELEKSKFDPAFNALMERMVHRAIQYVATQASNLIESSNHSWTFGRMNRVQSQTYNILNMVYRLSQDYPLGSIYFSPVLDYYKNCCLKAIHTLIRTVLGSMYDESVATRPSVSPYMTELADHLASFSAHFHCIHMLCTPVEEVHDFVNYVFEQFLLHISLVKPMTKDSVRQFTSDLRFLLNVIMKHFNCRTSGYINSRTSIIKLFEELPEVILSRQSITSVVPNWFLINIIISFSNDLPMLYDSAGWTRIEYIDWFCKESDASRVDFVNSFLQAVENKYKNLCPELSILKQLTKNWNNTFNNY